jgi:hypothetical protein
MSDPDVLPDDMDPLDAMPYPPPTDFGTIDRVLAGRLDEADAPPGYAGVARLVAAATPPIDPGELAGKQAVVAEFVALARARPPTPSPRRAGVRSRLVRVKATAVVVAAVLSIGGVAAAATGHLPKPAPSVADRAAATAREDPAARPPTGSSTTAAAPAASPSRTTRPPARPNLAEALADLTRVVTTAQRQGTADPAAADLLPQARDVVRATRNGNTEDARKMLADLQRKTDELIQQGKIGPAATGPIRRAVAQLSAAVQRSKPSAQPPGSQGSGRRDAAADHPDGPPEPGRGDRPDHQVAAKDR